MSMKVKYIGESDPLELLNGKIYEVLSVEGGDWYRIVDETEEDYLFPSRAFEIVEDPEGRLKKAEEYREMLRRKNRQEISDGKG